MYSIAVAFLFKISAAATIANIYLQFFITFLPGLAIYALIRKKNDHWVNIIALGYALGYGINILQYFLLMPFGLGDYLKFVSPIISLLSIFILIKHSNPCASLGLQRSDTLAPVLFFFLTLAADVIIYSGANISPTVTGSSTYLRDVQYWVNTSIGLFLNFPPQAPYLSGFTLYYHYFSNIHVAFSSLVSNIDIFTLSFPLYPLTKSLLLIGGLNFFLDTFNATKFQKLLLLITILFSTGIERISIVTNFHHFHLAPLGLDVGFAYGAFFIASFVEDFRESNDPLNRLSFLATMLFYVITVGAKAPLAVALSIFPGVVCIVWLFRKKFNYCFTYGIGIIAIFMIVNIFCVGTFSTLNNLSVSQGIQLSSIEALLIINKFTNTYLNLILSVLFALFTAQPVLVFLFAIACIMYGIDLGKDKLQTDQIIIQGALISTTLISMAFSQIIDHVGNSEMYFMMAAYIPMIALSIYTLNSLSNAKYPIVQKVILTICLPMLMIQIYYFLFAAWGGYSATSSIKTGIENIRGNLVQFSSDADIPINSIQQTDFDGLVWIRENTPKNTLIAVDRAIYSANDSNLSHYYSYAMFAERQTFIEGNSMSYVLDGADDNIIIQRQELMRALFSNAINIEEKIRAEGIDYIVQTRWVTPEFQPPESFTLVHQTDSLNIFRVD